jgi:type IV pilus biogenesis protein CpaD/CtpE
VIRLPRGSQQAATRGPIGLEVERSLVQHKVDLGEMLAAAVHTSPNKSGAGRPPVRSDPSKCVYFSAYEVMFLDNPDTMQRW